MTTRRNFLKSSAGVALAAGVAPLLPTTASATAPLAGTQAAGFYRFMLGEFEITALSDGTIDLPLAEISFGLPPDEVAAYFEDRFQASPVRTSVNAFLVNTGDRLVLVDAGTGPSMGPTLGHLVANLEASGYRADQVDDVILTHIHPDHAGGLATGDAPTFENATIHLNHREARFWLEADAALRADENLGPSIALAEASVLPYQRAERLVTFEDNAEPLPGFGSILRDGHTPGHSSITVESNGQKIVFWGDIVHSDYIQYDHPDVTVAIDIDQPAAIPSRMAAFSQAADERYLVAGAHHAFPGIGRVRRRDSTFEWIPLLYGQTL